MKQLQYHRYKGRPDEQDGFCFLHNSGDTHSHQASEITFLTAKYAEQSGVGVSRVSDQYPAGAVTVSEEWAWITTVFL